MKARMSFLFISILFASLITGCATSPYDYTALQASKPRSIVVIPPTNESVDVEAPYVFLSTITRPLAEKGYYVFPVSVIDQFMKENGLPTPEDMNNVPLDKISENIGADAVLYVNIQEWGQKFQLLSSVAIVKFHMRLLDAKTGALLWDASASAQKSSGDGGGGLAGALAAALVEQVVGNMKDQTPQLARQANHLSINNSSRGLLVGPYAEIK
jgi:hypothetical protein